MMLRRSVWFPWLLVICSVISGSSSAPASAASISHKLEGTFKPSDVPGVPGIPLRGVYAIAIDNSGGPGDGNAYIADGVEGSSSTSSRLGTVYKFDENGFYTGVKFDGIETPHGSFSVYDPSVTSSPAYGGLAVDSSSGVNSGNVYVVDIHHGLVNRFDETGNFICQISGVATPSPRECNGAVGSETPSGGFIPTAIAVDDSGILYVADYKNGVINKFNGSGAYIGQISDPHISKSGISAVQPSSMAFDSAGSLYLTNSGFLGGGQKTVKFDPGGSFAAVIDTQESIGVAVDHTTNYVLLSRGGGFFPGFGTREIVELNSAGEKLHVFAAGFGAFYAALAVNDSSGKIYMSNGSGIEIYSPDTAIPAATANPAEDVEETTATLSGDVDPDGGGDVISCRFEYWKTITERHSAPCSPAAPYAGPTPVSANLAGLKPSTTYKFQLAARNAGIAPHTRGVDSRSAEGTFTTFGPPTVDEQSAVDIDRYSATVRAKINPHTFDSEFKFEYVDAEQFAEGGFAGSAVKSTPFSEIGDGEKPRSVGQGIANLTVGTTYHYRAVAKNSRGTTLGIPQTFTTVPVATFEQPWAYAAVRSATLEGKINPLGLDTTCEVQYVTSAEFGESGFAGAATEPCLEGLGSGSTERLAKAKITGLQIDETYRYRFAATNDSGTLAGPEQSLTTFGFDSFSVEVLDEEGNDFTQAGGYPFESVNHYSFNHNLVPSRGEPEASLNGLIKDLITESPRGRIADTDATPRCPGYLVDEEACPPESQIGTMSVEYYRNNDIETSNKPLYNVSPPEGVLSRYASLDPYTRSDSRLVVGGDYFIRSGNLNITEEARAISGKVTLWGVPADPRHDSERSCNGSSIPRPQDPPCPSTAPLVPMFRNPTSCTGPLVTTAKINGWGAPNDYAEAEAITPAITGCDQIEFEPTFTFQPTTKVADSPTGLEFNIHVPQNEDPYGTSVADLKDTVFEVPEGLIINPAVADGLVGCTEEQVRMEREGPAECPDASKIGSAEINTPLLDHRIHGAIHVAEPYANEFGSLFAIYITFHDRESGVVIKLAGPIDADGGIGQLTSSFSENPQLAFEDFRLKFFAGPRAVLKTPPACGTYTTKATLTPWSHPHSGPPVKTSDSFQIAKGPGGMPCPRKEADAPHQPGFQAGTVSPIAGAHSPFVLHLRREDGTQRFASLSLIPPPGLMGRLAGIPYCPDASIEAARSRKGRDEKASPSCPQASRVGSVTVAAGAGPAPFRVKGDAYLAGPHNGAPLSLAAVVPALGGPYDLGTIVVRSGLSLGLETAELSVATEPLPTILEGVSLNVRSISVELDKDNFILNPTSCDPMSIKGELISTFGHIAPLKSRFQLGNCGRLGFDPELKISVKGKTQRRAHPSLKAVLTMPKAKGANIESATVEMPPSFFLDSDRIKGVCTREQFSARECPEDSIYGYAKVWSPLLDQPLKGPVRMRSSNDRLPNLVADLDGQVRVIVGSNVGSVSNGLGIKTTVENIPDVPVSRAELRMLGGPRGLLQNAADLCAGPQRLRFAFKAHNGKVKRARRVVGVRCGGR